MQVVVLDPQSHTHCRLACEWPVTPSSYSFIHSFHFVCQLCTVPRYTWVSIVSSPWTVAINVLACSSSSRLGRRSFRLQRQSIVVQLSENPPNPRRVTGRPKLRQWSCIDLRARFDTDGAGLRTGWWPTYVPTGGTGSYHVLMMMMMNDEGGLL